MLGRTVSSLSRGVASKAAVRRISGLLESYGDHVFKGAVAEAYLTKQGLPDSVLN